MRDVEIPSSNNALRARSKASSPVVRAATARADAIPKDSLNSLPLTSLCRSPGDSYVPANHDPIMTWDAPAANASATSRGWRTPPSAHTWAPNFLASVAHSRTAENWGLPTPVCMRVVHIAPGPTPTLMMVAPASTKSLTPSAVTTLPATIGTENPSAEMALSASIIFF